MRASRWWAQWADLMNLSNSSTRSGNLSGYTAAKNRRIRFKSMASRGRKRAEWVNELYSELLQEFERLKKYGMKLSPSVLRSIAISLIQSAPPDSTCNDPVIVGGKHLREKITTRWIQSFMESARPRPPHPNREAVCQPTKTTFYREAIAFHLGSLKRGFESGYLNEDRVENADETHFVFSMDNGRTIGLRGDEDVKYADAMSGDECITMMVRVTGDAMPGLSCPC